MWVKAVYFVNLLLAGTLVGSEFGTWAAVHPALGGLSGAENIRAEQEITRRYGGGHALLDVFRDRLLPACAGAHAGYEVLLSGARRHAVFRCDARRHAGRERTHKQPDTRDEPGDGSPEIHEPPGAVGFAPHRQDNSRHRRTLLLDHGRALPVWRSRGGSKVKPTTIKRSTRKRRRKICVADP